MKWNHHRKACGTIDSGKKQATVTLVPVIPIVNGCVHFSQNEGVVAGVIELYQSPFDVGRKTSISRLGVDHGLREKGNHGGELGIHKYIVRTHRKTSVTNALVILQSGF
ncbi:MAG: hypothetical protein ACKVKR_13825 [Pseudomonadales bacterium]